MSPHDGGRRGVIPVASPGRYPIRERREGRNVSLILIVLLVLILIGTLPTWPYSSGWGPYPSGGVGLVLLILVILLLTGRL
jgi:hypothetical protein